MIIIEGTRVLFPRLTVDLINMSPERRQKIIRKVKKVALKKGIRLIDTR